MTQDNYKDIETRNKKILAGVFFGVLLMVGLAFASVPLYDLFCRVTGTGGTVERVADTQNMPVLDRKMDVRFHTTMSPDIPWEAGAEEDKVTVNVGERRLINYVAHNTSGKTISGTALYNVTPIKAAKYFKKIQCFCFGEQVLTPGQTVNMPVLFYVDPAIDDDVNLKDVKTIILSYSFYKQDSAALEEQLNNM